MSAPTAASLEADASRAETGSGPAVRVVGVHAWNGTADSLNASPATRTTVARLARTRCSGTAHAVASESPVRVGSPVAGDPQGGAEDEQAERHQGGREQGEGAVGGGPAVAPGDEGDDGQGRELEGDEPGAEVARGDDGDGAAGGREQHDDVDDAGPADRDQGEHGEGREQGGDLEGARAAAPPSHRQRPSGAGVQSVSRGPVASEPGERGGRAAGEPEGADDRRGEPGPRRDGVDDEDEDHRGDGEEGGEQQRPRQVEGHRPPPMRAVGGVGRDREDEVRRDADGDDGDGEDGDDGELDAARVRRPVGCVGGHGVTDPDDAGHPQGVGRGQRRAHRRDDGAGAQDPGVLGGVPRGDEREELAPEAGEAGQAEAGREPEDEGEAEAGRHLAQRGPHDGEVDRAPAVLEAADDDEEQGRDDAVGDVADERGLESGLGAGGEAEDDEAHVRHRREGDEPLEVALDEADEAAPEDADDTGDREDRARSGRSRRARSPAAAGRGRRCRA